MGSLRGSRRWFTVEVKSFEILVEGVGRRKQFFIIEKSKGGILWIRFGEGSLGTLLKGANECCRKKVSDKWRIEWWEEKRSFSLESRANKARCFLLCEVRDEEGKKHNLIFSEGTDKKKRVGKSSGISWMNWGSTKNKRRNQPFKRQTFRKIGGLLLIQ